MWFHNGGCWALVEVYALSVEFSVPDPTWAESDIKMVCGGYCEVWGEVGGAAGSSALLKSAHTTEVQTFSL